MGIASKITCLAVLLCSFLLIFVTGRSNVRNFEKVKNSIEEIYKDRLVVKGLIFKLSSLLHQKEMALVDRDLNVFLKNKDSVNQKIEEHLKAFRETKLTHKEKINLDMFSQGIEHLQVIEGDIVRSKGAIISRKEYDLLNDKLEILKDNLVVLSDIQLEEGQQKMKAGDHAVKRMNEFASLENYGLLVIALMMVVLIFIPGSGKTTLGQ